MNIKAEFVMPFNCYKNGKNYQSYSSFWQLPCVGPVAPLIRSDVGLVVFSTSRGAAALSADVGLFFLDVLVFV